LTYYGGSRIKALVALYPELKFQKWLFTSYKGEHIYKTGNVIDIKGHSRQKPAGEEKVV